MTEARQLSFEDLKLRLVATGIPDGLPPVMRWRKLLRRVEPPDGSQVSVATFRAVGTVLADYADREGGSCFPSVKLIASDSGFAVRTAKYALAALEEVGLVEKRRRRRMPTSYTLLVPPVEKPVDKSPGSVDNQVLEVQVAAFLKCK